MTRTEKKFLSIKPGTLGVNVVNNDIAFALKEFKTIIKRSGKLNAIKKCYVKPSIRRKEKLDSAKFKQYLKTKRELC